VLIGVGGAAVVTGVIVYAVGAGAISSAQSACGGQRKLCPASVANQGNGGRTAEDVGGVVGGVGLAAAAAGIVWKLVGSGGSSASTGASIAPVFAPGYVGLNVGGAL
jgi:hypothetical protein